MTHFTGTMEVKKQVLACKKLKRDLKKVFGVNVEICATYNNGDNPGVGFIMWDYNKCTEIERMLSFTIPMKNIAVDSKK